MKIADSLTDFDVYYSNYHHYKKTQKSFIQTILSLLCLEASNINTGKSFSIEMEQITRNIIRNKNIPQKFMKKVIAINKIFRNLIYQPSNKRNISIRLLKGMRCTNSDIKQVGMIYDLSEEYYAKIFFTDVLACYFSSNLDYVRKKLIFCVGEIPYHELELVNLLNLGFGDFYEQLEFKSIEDFKLSLTTRGILSSDKHSIIYINENEYLNRIPKDLFIVKKIATLSNIPIIELTISRVLNDLRESTKTYGNIPHITKSVIKEIVKILNNQDVKNISVVTLSQYLLTLLGYAMEIDPLIVTKEELNALFRQ